ncbi:MAG: hypothetical protein ABSA54_08500 [Terriglobales bacterium]
MMNPASKVTLIGLGLFLLGVILFPPHSQSSSDLGVRVLNTPLPVQGTVGVSNFPANQTVNGTVSVGNTPSVNVANTPSVSVSSLPAVQITGSVNAAVSNPTGTSGTIPLVTLDGAAHTAFLTNNGCIFSGTTNDCSSYMLSIPANQVAVVESFSGYCNLDQGSAVLQLSLATNVGSGPWLAVTQSSPVSTAGIPVPGLEVVQFGQNIKGYFFGGSGGATLYGYIKTTTLQNAASFELCEFNLAGHLDPQ